MSSLVQGLGLKEESRKHVCPRLRDGSGCQLDDRASCGREFGRKFAVSRGT